MIINNGLRHNLFTSFTSPFIYLAFWSRNGPPRSDTRMVLSSRHQEFHQGALPYNPGLHPSSPAMDLPPLPLALIRRLEAVGVGVDIETLLPGEAHQGKVQFLGQV
jgi:hypothetical protein